MGSARAVGASWLVVLACAGDARAQFGGAPLPPRTAATSAPHPAPPTTPKRTRSKRARSKPTAPRPTDPPPTIEMPTAEKPTAPKLVTPATPPALAPAPTTFTAPTPLLTPSAAVTAPAPTLSTASPVASSRDRSGRRLDGGSGSTHRRVAIAGRPVTVTAPSTQRGTQKKFTRALARRALLLPLGVVQGTAMLTIEAVSPGKTDLLNRAFLDPRVRIGIGFGEVELGGSVLAYEPTDVSMRAAAPERFVTAFAAAKLKILRNTAVGGELTVRSPVSDSPIYAPRAVAATKLQPSTTNAVEVALRAGEDVLAEDHRMFVASGELRLQTQLSEEVALEARGLVAYFRPNAELAAATMARSYFAQTYGIRIVGAISHEVDVIMGFDATLARDRDTVKLFSIGFAARRVP